MKKMKRCLAVLAAVLSLCSSASIYAEIQTVTIVWTRGLCTQMCMKNLDRQLRQMNGVADLQMNQATATAIINWKPFVPFSWQALEAPMSAIGLSIEHLRTKVVGKISHDDRTVWLTSTGDGTRFVVLGVLNPNPAGATETYNTESYALSSQQRSQFLDAESQNLLVTIEGSIFMPERAPPLVLIAEKTSFGKPDTGNQTGPGSQK